MRVLREAGLIVTIPVADLERSRAFYEDVLGFEHIATSEAGVLCRAGDGRLLLYHSAAPAPAHTLAGFEVAELEPVIRALTERGVTFEQYDFPGLRTVDHIAWIGPERAAWFRDSEGNVLSISEPWRERPAQETAEGP
jgi:catechol 2,3-dioxygenase-like lactoylglutathione lyase family enzyme